jgi:hypothetical protein
VKDSNLPCEGQHLASCRWTNPEWVGERGFEPLATRARAGCAVLAALLAERKKNQLAGARLERATTLLMTRAL